MPSLFKGCNNSKLPIVTDLKTNPSKIKDDFQNKTRFDKKEILSNTQAKNGP
jgi:hypothetical protein